MPDRAKHDVIARQWSLLKLLPSRPPGKSAKELADGLGLDGFQVSKRTVERDLINLMRLFPIGCNDRGTPYGWHWIEGARLDLPGMTVAEALSLRLIAQYLKPLVPASLLRGLEPRFQLASSKLAAMASANQASRWMDKVAAVAPALTLLPPRVDAVVFETVQEALLADDKLDIAYQAAGKKAAIQIRLSPLALVQRGPVAYLVAMPDQHEDVRLYAVHRIRTASRLDQGVRRPKGFMLDRYIASGALEFGAGKELRLEANISKELAGHLAETPLSTDMKLEQRNEDFRLSGTVADSPQLRWWILSHGAAVEVLKPISLREELSSSLRMASARYSD